MEYTGKDVQKIMDKIQEVTGTNYRVEIVDYPDKNTLGYADKTNTIKITKTSLGYCEDSIAHTIAHEITHKEEKHLESSTQLVDTCCAGFENAVKNADGFVGKFIAGAVSAALTVAATGIVSGFHEYVADSEADEIAKKAGYDPMKKHQK